MALPPPPNNSTTGSRQWKDWFSKVQQSADTTTSVTWSGINFTGSDIADILTRPHSALQSIQGTGAFHVSTSEATSITTGVWPGAITSSSPSSGVGYSAGAGGTVTQATSKSTSVTLNKTTGEITMNGAALAAGAIVSFTLTNSSIAATDVMVLNHVTTGTLGAYLLNAQCNSGTATISVRNTTSGSLSQAIVIRFAVIKAVTS
jgi:hypothetical protein